MNASQAVDKNHSWVKISAATGNNQRDHTIIEVSDNGCGMDEKTRRHIFNPFYTTKSPVDGTGLGLYVCHNLIQGIGGYIEVESQPGEGSTFRVVLPDKDYAK
jgi:signal transduction histidine kinase